MLLAKEDIAKKMTDTPIWLKGYGSCTDAYYLGNRNMTNLIGLELAAKEAYRMAGVNNPIENLDFIESLEGVTVVHSQVSVTYGLKVEQHI